MKYVMDRQIDRWIDIDIYIYIEIDREKKKEIKEKKSWHNSRQ